METYLQSSVFVSILKAPSEDADHQDPYIEHLKKVNIPSKFIPTLQFHFKNLDVLHQRLNNPENYAGIVFNSPRCVHAVIESLNNKHLKDEWKSLKCFVVGEATGRLVENALNLDHEGSSAGNLANLLQDISKHNFEKPLLMPVSSLHKDSETSIKLEKIEVYETCEHEHLESSLKDIQKSSITNILVFFSPSGVKSALRYIPSSTNGKFQFIAIGPTTAEEMKKCHLEVHGVCKKPNPESLIEVILQFYGKNNETGDLL